MAVDGNILIACEVPKATLEEEVLLKARDSEVVGRLWRRLSWTGESILPVGDEIEENEEGSERCHGLVAIWSVDIVVKVKLREEVAVRQNSALSAAF